MKDNFKHLLVNKQISSPIVNLVDTEGKIRKGILLEEALAEAVRQNLDLVQLNVNSDQADTDVPVCKIMNYSKYRYQKQKKLSVQNKKNVIKEIQLRLNIEDHDYHVKLRAIEKFITNHFKVVVILKLFGREFLHKDLGMQLLNRIVVDLKAVAKVEKGPLFNGRKLLMMLRKV